MSKMKEIWTPEMRKKRSEEVSRRWQERKFREKAIKSQERIGLRNYGEPLNHFKKEHLKGY